VFQGKNGSSLRVLAKPNGTLIFCVRDELNLGYATVEVGKEGATKLVDDLCDELFIPTVNIGCNLEDE